MKLSARKNIIYFILLVGITLLAATGCGSNETNQTGPANETELVTVNVGASPLPHAEILEVVKPLLKDEGIELNIIEFTDYVKHNLALSDKDLDANYFQHIPYLEDFSSQRNLDLTFNAKVHIEPMGVYSIKIESLDELKEGALVAIPNDPTNGGRALLLLESAGLIKLNEGSDIDATKNDIVENPKNLDIRELEAATLPRVLEDVEIAVINTNYALEADFVPTEDALYIETSDSPYVNVLAIRKGDEDRPELIKLAEALNSAEVKQFIEEEYEGAVVPAF